MQSESAAEPKAASVSTMADDHTFHRAPQALHLVGLVALAGVCAFVTFFHFDAFLASPRVRAGQGSGLFDLFVGLMVFLPVTAPFVLIMALVPLPATLGVLKVHAAAFTCLLVVELATSTEGRSSPADGFAPLIRLVLFTLLGAELAIGLYAEGRINKEYGEWARPRLLYSGLVLAVFGGCLGGGLAWSWTIPARVVAGAEAQAGELPYCINVNGRPARGRADLTGQLMRADWHGGFAGNFHAVLVVEAPAERRYLNWSYRANGFQPIDRRAVQRYRLDTKLLCEPVLHSARSWL